MPIIAFINDYKIYEVPCRFSYQHFLLLLITIIYTVVLSLIIKKRTERTRKTILNIIAIACLIIFSGRMLFGWNTIWSEGSKTSLLMLELCNFNIILVIISINWKNRYLRSYLYFNVMLGALIPLIIFPDVHMITAGNNLFHYMFFDYFLIHSSLFAVPIAMLASKMIMPKYKDVPKMLLALFAEFSLISLVTFLIRNVKGFKTANYMYSMSHANLPLLKNLYDLIPIPYVYMLPLAIPTLVIFYLMMFLYHRFTKKERA